MTDRRVSNPLALAVLACVRERPMHPYEMASTLKERSKHESIKLNYGSLYSVVDALVREGCIVALETVREGNRPERTIYGITDAGAEELVDWLSELLRVPVKEYPSFASGLSLMLVLPPERAAELLEERAGTLEAKLRESKARSKALLKQGLPRVVLIEAEYEQALEEAELRFVRRLAREIGDGALDGVEWWRSFHADGGDEKS